MTFWYSLLLTPLLLQAAFSQALSPPSPASIRAETVVGSNLSIDISGVKPGPIIVDSNPVTLTVHWNDEKSRSWEAVFSLSPSVRQPLISAISVEGKKVIDGAVPWYRCQTGKKGGPAGFNEFADFPPDDRAGTRAFRAYFEPKRVKVRTIGDRVEVAFDGMSMGIFAGSLKYIFYPGSRLIEQQAAMSTQEPDTAFFYDAGLRMRVPQDETPGDLNQISHVSYYDTAGKFQTIASARPNVAEMNTLAVRYRAVVGKVGVGSVAVFPAPHQYMMPSDWTSNMGYVWYSAWRGDLTLGIRNHPENEVYYYSKNYPWMIAPPGSVQEMRMFLLVSDQDMRQTLDGVLRYTHGDRFPKVPGYITVSGHFHQAFLMKARQFGFGVQLPFEAAMRNIGLDVAVINDFHGGDAHPSDPGEIRLQEQFDYFRATRARSDKDFLVIPGEEANCYLGGHWTVIFPKPVYWHMVRNPDQPVTVQDPKYGTVYNVGNEKELWDMITKEHGIAYTSHPRNKGSYGYPDKYLDSFFFRDPRFIGTGWKDMPKNLSLPYLSDHYFKTIDDINNLGFRKRLFGEVDTFQSDPTHELYGSMNVMYVHLPSVPAYNNVAPLLDAIQNGNLFHTTGEILIPDADVKDAGEAVTATSTVNNTFPLRVAEIVWGDGKETHRQAFPLEDTHEFGNQRFSWRADAPGWKWARMEVWDVAGNGAFTSPIFR